MCFEIRKAKISDLGAAQRLDQEAFGVDAWSILDFAGLFSFSSARKFTAAVDGNFAGFAASEYDSERGAVCLMTLAVRPEYRGRGIGTALIKACEEAFPGMDCYLTVDCENESAIRLYQQLGYQKTDVRPAYYFNGHDAWEMEKSGAGDLGLGAGSEEC